MCPPSGQLIGCSSFWGPILLVSCTAETSVASAPCSLQGKKARLHHMLSSHYCKRAVLWHCKHQNGIGWHWYISGKGGQGQGGWGVQFKGEWQIGVWISVAVACTKSHLHFLRPLQTFDWHILILQKVRQPFYRLTDPSHHCNAAHGLQVQLHHCQWWEIRLGSKNLSPGSIVKYNISQPPYI